MPLLPVAAMRSHSFNLYSLPFYLQIVLFATIALAASALAFAAHHQSPRCATPFFPASACICFGRRRGSLFARSSLGGSLGLPTDVRIRVFFVPSGAVWFVPWLFGWQQGMLAGSCALDHRSDHNQNAASTNPERKRIVGMLAAISHVISLSTPCVVAGPPARPVIRRR